jgi:serine/threonine-protein kinase
MKAREAGPQVLSADWLPEGTRVGRWQVVGRLGDGGFGTVYAVARAGWGRKGLYALKLARRPDDARFGSEAQALRRVRHRGVVRRLEEGVWKAGPVGYPYVVLEYVPGASLYGWAQARNPTARQVAELLAQAAEALGAAHRRGVLHRDFKGGNVRVRPDGRLKVLDWGAGWYAGAPRLTSTARLPPGTPPYYSPQALRWRMDVQRGRAGGHYTYTVADELYAVGVTFYRLLAEEYPPLRLGEGAAESCPLRTVNPRVPEALAAVVMGLLAFRPEQRPGSAKELAGQVRALLVEAEAGWEVPLFAWAEGPSAHSRTTGEASGAAGPVAPGDEVALRNAQARYRDQVWAWRAERDKRRRDPARVLTLHEPEAARGGPWWRSARARRAAWSLGVVLATAVAWAALRPLPPASAPAAPRAERQKVAPAAMPSEADLLPAAPALPPPPQPEEAMSPQPSLPALVSRPSSPRPGVLASLRRGAVAAGAAVTLAGCTGAQVRADATRCTPEALECMRNQLGLELGQFVAIILDERQPDTLEDLLVLDGPIVSLTRAPEGRLPPGTRLYGRLWTRGERVIGHFTRAETPGGQSYPVCIDLNHGKNPNRPPPAEGAWMKGGASAQVVDTFTPPPSPAR